MAVELTPSGLMSVKDPEDRTIQEVFGLAGDSGDADQPEEEPTKSVSVPVSSGESPRPTISGGTGNELVGEIEKLAGRLMTQGYSARAARKEALKAISEEQEALGIGRQQEIRRQTFQEATGSAELREGLKEDVLSPEGMAPVPITERIATVGLQPAVIGGNVLTALAEKVTGKEYGRTDADELAKTKFGKLLGNATAGVGAAVVGAAAAPYVAAAVARSAIFKAVVGTGGSVPFLRTAIEGVAIFTVGKSVFDYRGDEMDQLRQGIKKVVEDGERIEAANRNGLPSGDTIELLSQMTLEVEQAEARIKQLGNNNLQYRVSKEYILDQQNVRSAREALLRRVLAVENIAATGQASLDPEALMYNVSEFG